MVKKVSTASRRYTRLARQAQYRATDEAIMQQLLALPPREKFMLRKMTGITPSALKKVTLDRNKTFRKDTRLRLQMFLGIHATNPKPIVRPELHDYYSGAIQAENTLQSPKEYLQSFGLDEY